VKSAGCADTGDQWRPATIISDAQTLLSNNFLDGFPIRADLNNNQGNSAENREERVLEQQFCHWCLWAVLMASLKFLPDQWETPIQRRANFPEYVMEICRKLFQNVNQGLGGWL